MVVILVISFGVIAIVGSIFFGMYKLKGLCNDIFLIDGEDIVELCKNDTSCKTLKEMNTDYLERRNEFWCIFVQIIIILFILTVLTVLLILEKVTPEAAIPVMAGLASFVAGKGIANAKTNNTRTEKLPERQR